MPREDDLRLTPASYGELVRAEWLANIETLIDRAGSDPAWVRPELFNEGRRPVTMDPEGMTDGQLERWNATTEETGEQRAARLLEARRAYGPPSGYRAYKGATFAEQNGLADSPNSLDRRA